MCFHFFCLIENKCYVCSIIFTYVYVNQNAKKHKMRILKIKLFHKDLLNLHSIK